jgi:hypothetical protein
MLMSLVVARREIEHTIYRTRNNHANH